MTSLKIRQYLTFNMQTPIPKLLFLKKSSKKIKKYMAVIQPRPTHILYQCANLVTIGRHLTSFVMCAKFNIHVKGLYPYFDISGIKSVSHAKAVIFTIFESP